METTYVDSQFLQKPNRHFAVVAGRFDGLSATVSEQQSLSCMKFISCGVSAEIIVVVEDENLGLLSCKLAVEVCCGQTADAGADNDQIIRLTVVEGFGPIFVIAVAQFVRNFPGTIVTAAKAGFSRRVIAGIFLRSERRSWEAEGLQPCGICRHQGRSDGHADSIQEIATGNLAPHAQFTIFIPAPHSLLPKLSVSGFAPQLLPAIVRSTGNGCRCKVGPR